MISVRSVSCTFLPKAMDPFYPCPPAHSYDDDANSCHQDITPLTLALSSLTGSISATTTDHSDTKLELELNGTTEISIASLLPDRPVLSPFETFVSNTTVAPLVISHLPINDVKALSIVSRHLEAVSRCRRMAAIRVKLPMVNRMPDGSFPLELPQSDVSIAAALERLSPNDPYNHFDETISLQLYLEDSECMFYRCGAGGRQVRDRAFSWFFGLVKSLGKLALRLRSLVIFDMLDQRHTCAIYE
jgi:hypothetical protein